MDTETARLRDELAALKFEEKELRDNLRKGATQVPLPQLKSDVADMEAQKAELEARLAKLKGGNTKPVSAEEKGRVNSCFRVAKRSLDARKKIRGEMWLTIEDVVGKEKGVQMKDEMGLEF